MEGEPSRGFHRILSRLDDATRHRYCAEALDEELRCTLTQFEQCAQAMAHARQVNEATQSLIANACSSIHVSSSAATTFLTELHGLQKTLRRSIRTLTGSADAQPVAQQAEEEEEPSPERECDEIKMLEKTRSILTKQRRNTWLSDALEMACSAVRVMEQHALPSPSSAAETTQKTVDSPEELRIYDVFKLLRKCVLKHTATDAEKLPVLRKLLKRLAKKRPALAAFVEKSEELLATKEAKLAENRKQKTEPTPPPTKSKKRQLPGAPETRASDDGDAPTTPSSNTTTTTTATANATGVPRATLDLRSKMLLCSRKTVALRDDAFSLTAFDVCLKMAIEVVNALSPQLTGDDVAHVSSTLAQLVDKAMQIPTRERREDRLVCLEGLLSVVVTSERLQWSSSQAKASAVECRFQCRQRIASLRGRAYDATAEDALSTVDDAPPAKRKKKHMRFDGE